MGSSSSFIASSSYDYLFLSRGLDGTKYDTNTLVTPKNTRNRFGQWEVYLDNGVTVDNAVVGGIAGISAILDTGGFFT